MILFIQDLEFSFQLVRESLPILQGDYTHLLHLDWPYIIHMLFFLKIKVVNHVHLNIDVSRKYMNFFVCFINKFIYLWYYK